MKPLSWFGLLSIGLIATVAFLVYGESLGNAFVDWDDVQLIVQNPLIRTFSPRIFFSYDPELYVPLTLLTFQIEHALFGFNALIFHLDSLLLHIANALLVGWFLLILLRNRWAACLGALLFAVHPLHVESVAWVSARKELLWAFFFLLTVIAYELGREDRRWRLMSMLFLTLSLLSKPTALLTPFVLLLLDWRRGERVSLRSWKRTWPHFLLAYAAGVIALIGRGEQIGLLNPLQVLLLAFRSTVFYLEKLILPLHLSPLYAPPDPISLGNPAILFSILIVLALLAGTWFPRRYDRTAALGIGIFFLALLPTFLAYQKSGFVTPAADRYAYVPSIGIILTVAALLLHAPGALAKRIIAVVAIATSVTFGVLAYRQSLVWASTESLFTHALREDPGSPIAMNNLATLALERGNIDEAILLSSEAVRLKPLYADAYVTLGAALAKEEKYDRAEEALQRALEINPDHAHATFNLAGVEQMRGNLDRAVELYRRATALQLSHADAFFQRGRVLLKQGKRDEARAAYRSAVELRPQLRGVSREMDALE